MWIIAILGKSKELKGKHKLAKKFLKYQGGDFEIAYELCNANNQECILFLHGWGSNKEIMKGAFGGRFRDFTHLYIDLPGFGKSSNTQVIDTYDYAKIVSLFLKEVKLEPSVVFGHSFGGKVATLLNPKELVLLSSAGIPQPKPLSVQIKIICAKIFKKLRISSSALRSQDVNGMSEVMYEVFKRVVDEDFTSIFSQCTSKALLLWGKEDSATPLKSGERIASLMRESVLYALEGDHFFFIKQSTEIEKRFLEWKK